VNYRKALPLVLTTPPSQLWRGATNFVGLTAGNGQVDPSAAEAAAHRAIALKRAELYYRYELQIGSNNVQVTGLDFEIIDVNPIAGWTGRYRTEAKAFVSYYDSAGGSFKRITSIFEVVTEQKLKEPIQVVDFTRKR
jgi:hypothetical protein